ncbi:MAG TPA: diguanylate cyclase, partial [Woeseiaceae bacterium]
EALAIAERVRDSVSGSMKTSSDSLIQIPVEISMGVAELTADGDFESLLRAADEALYRAKDAGRNTVSG